MSSQPTDDSVKEIFDYCVLKEGESTAEPLVSTPYIGSKRAEFSVARLEHNRAKISNMLAQLHGTLLTPHGGHFGLAFSTNINGKWTYSSQRVEELLLLGYACSFVWMEDTNYGITLNRTLRTANDGTLYVGTDENDALLGGNY